MKHTTLILLAVAGLAAFSSCKKDDNNTPVGSARIQYVNAAATGTNYDIYEKNAKVYTNVAFMSISGYRTVESSNASLAVTATNTIDPKLLSSSVNPPANSSQTVFINRQSSGSTTLNALVLNDTITGATSGKAMVRFVNLAPASGSLQITNGGLIVGGLTYIRAYREYTRYVAVDPAAFNADVREATSGNSIMAQNLTLTAGKYYTVAIVGEPGTSGGGVSTLAMLTVPNE